MTASGETAGAPTEPVDYGALNVVFGGLLAALAVASRDHPERVREALAPAELPLVAAATFSIAKAVTRERIGVWVREPFVEGEDGGRRPRGRRLRHAIGELVTCSRCIGVWSALGLVALRVGSPHGGRVATGVLATAAANDVLQAAFRLLCERANAAPAQAPVSSPQGRGRRGP